MMCRFKLRCYKSKEMVRKFSCAVLGGNFPGEELNIQGIFRLKLQLEEILPIPK